MSKNVYFRSCMRFINKNCHHLVGDIEADQQLLIAVQCEMSKKLRINAALGRHGWWNPNVCSVEDLYAMRDKALADNDHVSVLNFTAMIAMRESQGE